MAFVLRRPFVLASNIAHLPPSRSIPFSATRFFSTPSKASIKSTKSAFSSRFPQTRNYRTQPIHPIRTSPPNTGSNARTSKILYGLAIIGGTAGVTHLILNRETRDSPLTPYQRAYLNSTFAHTGIGLSIIALTARTLHSSGWSLRLMSTNPWIVIVGGLAMSLGTMYGTFNTDPENKLQKYAFWTGFNVTQAAVLAPLMFFSPALLARAGIYTVGVMGALCFVGATAKTDQYLYLGGPLLAGVAVVAISGFAPLILPATAARTLLWSERMWLYGGLAIFGGFTLYDIQKVLRNARMAEGGRVKRDTVNESISLELDFLNIFIRMVQILGMQKRK